MPDTPRSKTIETRRKAERSRTNGVDRIFPANGAAAIASPTREKNPRPFTVPHFKAWAKGLLLDNDQPWIVEPFQARFLADLFGSFLEHWLVLPEGNAKTTLAGGIALYYAEHLKYARIPVAASSRDQAEWLYQAAAGFVERSELKQFKCLEGYRRIKCAASGGRIQIFAADDRTGDGIVPGGLCLLEELHRHRDLSLYRTWRGKLEKRGAKLIAISTAGEPDGEFEAVRKTMRDTAEHTTRKGFYLRATTETTVLHEYAVPDDENPDNIENVFKANPLKTIDRPMLRRKKSSPAMTPAHWRRFVCGQPSRMESWVEPKVWDDLEWDVGNVVDGDQVYVCVRVATGVGIGIVSLRDGKAAVKMQVIPKPLTGRVGMWQVENALREIADRYDVLDISYDPDSFQRSAEILEEEGLPMSDVPQRARRLSQATSTIWRYISGGLLGHDGDPELRSQVLGARTKETIQGWHLDPEPHTAGVIAVALALHEATEEQLPPPMVVVPSGVA